MSLDRPNAFEIDLSAVARATARVRAQVGTGVMFFATLKADAYGYGTLPAARTVLAHGADALSLASLADAVALRADGVTVPILLYAGVPHDESAVRAYAAHRLIPTIHDEDSFQALGRHAQGRLDVAVKVDVGPERIGVPYSQAVDFIARVAAHPRMNLVAVNAHPNVRGGDRAMACLDWQHARMAALSDALRQRGVGAHRTVMASSKVLGMAGARMAFDAVDPGATLFSEADPDHGDTAQAFHALKSRLITVRTVERDAFLDEAPFDMQPGMRVGVAPIGYSDGVHRLHAGCALVRGRRVPLLGKPALEYLRLDLAGVPDARPGDEVVLIGAQGDERIAPREAMAHQGAARVIDLALQVGPRIPRIYLPA